MFSNLLKAIVCCLSVFLIAHCDRASKAEKVKPETVKAPAPVKTVAETEAPIGPVGVIEGVVKLTEGDTLPSFPPRLMMRQVLNLTQPAPMPASCPAETDADRQPVRLTAEGGLAGVMLAVTGYSRVEKRPPITHEIVIENCRLKPMFLVATKDDLLRVRSDTDYPFMPDLGDSNILQTLIKGQEKVVRLEQGGTRTILCGFTAPCGRTDVVILHHSLYTITDERGAFRIEKVPAGESVTVNAWHPLFRAADSVVSVQPNEVRQVSFKLSPLPAYIEPPPPSASRTNPARSRSKGAHQPPRVDEPILR